MTVAEKSVDLISYTHDREAHYKVTADEIFNLINNYTDQKDLSGLYSYFDKKYQLPECVVKQKIRQHIARSYLFKSGKFDSKLRIKNIPKSILRYGALVYALFFTKRKSKVKNFKLIIDDICAPHELERFEKLLNLVGKDKVLCITRDINIEQDFPEYCIYNKKLFRDINLTDLLKSIFNEFFFGVWVVLKASVKTKVNLFPASLEVIHSYLSFKALFESNSAEYVIQERHYGTNAVKNYLFKQLGGIASTSIQKNILQTDPMFFYIDIDILFSLGECGYEEMLNYGGRIDNISPSGSMFMEYYWFKSPKKSDNYYDILLLGQNISNAYEREDKFSEFMIDYYDCFRWLARFKLENPNYSIAIMHHASAGSDLIEEDILQNSNIVVLNKSDNTYQAAFSSKCNVTYGSTMGYELIGHNIPSIFMDPGYRCTFLPYKYTDKSNDVNLFRACNYKEFSVLLLNILRKKSPPSLYAGNFDEICLKSSHVSERIYNKLQ